VVIDFDQLSGSPPRVNELFGDVDDPYREDGFLLTTPESALRSIHPSSFYAGSIAVFNEYLDGVTILRAEDNRPFGMISAKFSRLTNNSDVTSEFTGVTRLGQLVTANFTRLRFSPLTLTTEFFPPSFSEVIEVRWIEPGPSNAMQVDDLTMSIVPEPSAVVLLASCAVLFAARGMVNRHRDRSSPRPRAGGGE
jgi:hypothetical protein